MLTFLLVAGAIGIALAVIVALIMLDNYPPV